MNQVKRLRDKQKQFRIFLVGVALSERNNFRIKGNTLFKKEQTNEKDAGALQLVMPAVPFPCMCFQDSNAAVAFRSKLSLEDANLSQVGLKGRTQTVCGFSTNDPISELLIKWPCHKKAGNKTGRNTQSNRKRQYATFGPCHTKHTTVIVIHYGGSKTLRRW